MYFIDNKGITDPQINLAIEEYALRTMDTDKDSFLLFYINAPSIIIGKNQNTIEEIDTEYVDANGIKVVRRLSGGGAVYHDLGNLNFSFITKDDGDSFRNFKKFTEPVVEALAGMGVKAELLGRNDILVEGRKISGNAQFSTNGRMFSHGTLMFDTAIDEVVSALKVRKDKIESKGIKSIRSRVAINVRNATANDLIPFDSILSFRTLSADTTSSIAVSNISVPWLNIRPFVENCAFPEIYVALEQEYHFVQVVLR